MLPVLTMLLLATLLQPARCLQIKDVRLEGGGGEYLEVGSGSSYILNCEYHSAYDDPISQVRWLKFGVPVYTWAVNSNPSVYPQLLGQVESAPSFDPYNLHFTQISYSLQGNYTCEVSTASATTTATIPLKVLDTSSGPYTCQVQLLRNMGNSSDDAGKKEAYQVDGTTGDKDVEFESSECTLVWTMSTPAVFPRPNVTCGYYSFDHDDIIHRLPAGLTLHKFPNESWQAAFQATHIQVKDVPQNHRLGCSVRIPDTSYRQVVRAEDDFLIDNLIDSAGCPNLLNNEGLGINVGVEAATYTCRGDILPADRTGKAIATLRCPDGHSAVFNDGTVGGWDWEMTLSCAENDLGWRTVPEDTKPLGRLYNPQDLPYCHPGVISGSGRMYLSAVWLTTILLWL